MENEIKLNPLKTHAALLSAGIYLLSLCAAGSARPVWAESGSTAGKKVSSTPLNSTEVELLGERCVLKGPYSVEILKRIHSVSPAYFTTTPESLEMLKERMKLAKRITLEGEEIRKPAKTQGTASSPVNKTDDPAPIVIPGALEPYRSHLIDWLNGVTTFYESLADAKKKRELRDFYEDVREFQKKGAVRSFKKQLERLIKNNTKKSNWGGLPFEEIFIIYTDSLKSNPEEIYHRLTREMKMEYTCDFDPEGEAETPANAT